MEAVFKALGDPHRRLLLDQLFERDGQTLTELESALPSMTRFGVMKHLRVLEAAGLVTTRRSGREKLHYLNPVPIRLVLDRWISKYAAPWIESMTELKRSLEGDAMSASHVYQLYIKTTPEKLWEAMTKSEFTKSYFGGSLEVKEWKAGAAYRYKQNNGDAMHYGTLLEVDPPRRLVQTFEHDLSDDQGGGPDDVSKVTWEIEPMGELCKLTLVHEFKGESQSYRGAGEGWPMILSGLKTLLETGERLPFKEWPGEG